MIAAILFDLDNCLCAADEPGQQLYAPAFEAITHACHRSHSPAVLQQAFADMWRLPFDFIAEKYAFTPAMNAAGWGILCRLEVATPMHGYGDLDVLQELPVKRFLVTSGFGRLQESKIRALGIARVFTAIHIDAIDQLGYRGKQAIFEEILSGHRLESDQVLIVGDNHDSEIAIGVRLGIQTVQTLRLGVPRSANATHHIRTLHELKTFLR